MIGERLAEVRKDHNDRQGGNRRRVLRLMICWLRFAGFIMYLPITFLVCRIVIRSYMNQSRQPRTHEMYGFYTNSQNIFRRSSDFLYNKCYLLLQVNSQLEKTNGQAWNPSAPGRWFLLYSDFDLIVFDFNCVSCEARRRLRRKPQHFRRQERHRARHCFHLRFSERYRLLLWRYRCAATRHRG